jgi:predicted unusual protein kinase regulating ubiquinone biosynthesis (AarF/ABC1/UbiB family)
MNLLLFFSLLVQYQIPIVFVRESAKSSIYDMLLHSNTIWQKFAQSLAQFLVQTDAHKDLGHMLEDFYSNCPRHDIEYSRSILRKELSHIFDEQSLQNMEFIASGTVSQTYTIQTKHTNKTVCVKIQHPNVREDIQNACSVYDAIKDSYLFPTQYKTITWMFFDSLREQCNSELEFNNSKQYSQSLKDLNFTHVKTGRDILITPEMITFSNTCLVMEYVPSTNVTHKSLQSCFEELGELNMARYLYMMTSVISHSGLITSCLHQDLHLGNMGYIHDKENDYIQVVIYDLGQYYHIDYEKFMTPDDAKIIRETLYYHYVNVNKHEFNKLVLSPFGLTTIESNESIMELPDEQFFAKMVINGLENPDIVKHKELNQLFLTTIKSTSACDLYKHACNKYIHEKYNLMYTNGIYKNRPIFHDLIFENHILGKFNSYFESFESKKDLKQK